jgi:hypothetical protein
MYNKTIARLRPTLKVPAGIQHPRTQTQTNKRRNFRHCGKEIAQKNTRIGLSGMQSGPRRERDARGSGR